MFKNFSAFVLSVSLVCLPMSKAMAKTEMPQVLQNQLIMLSDGSPASGDDCVIKSLFPAFYGKIPGVAGMVAVGLVDNDRENCAGAGMAPPVLKVVAARQVNENGPYQKIPLPANLQLESGLQVQQILSVKPGERGFWITVLYFGPNDPACCASQKTKIWVQIPG